jgi:hypothetical protein
MQMREGKPNKPASRSHAGGIISVKEGSTATKERSDNGNGNGNGGKLVAGGRRLAQNMENR